MYLPDILDFCHRFILMEWLHRNQTTEQKIRAKAGVPIVSSFPSRPRHLQACHKDTFTVFFTEQSLIQVYTSSSTPTGLAFMRYFIAFMYTLQLFIPPGCYQWYQTHWQHMDFDRRTNWKVISQWWFTAVLQWLSDIPYEKDAKLLGCHRNTGSR